jgi:alanine-synthesizing transaminase
LGVTDDEQFVMELLRSEHILFIHGTGFHWFEPDHVRIVFLPDLAVLEGALSRLDRFIRRKLGV